MIGQTIKILRNEIKSNILIGVELIIVGAFLWYIIDDMYVNISNYYKPLGFDTEHTFIAQMGYLNSKSPEYVTEVDSSKEVEQLWTILDRIKNYNGVEAASVSLYSSPHIGSNMNTRLGRDTTYTKNSVLVRNVSPDFFRVFKYKSLNGSTDELVKVLERGDIVMAPGAAKELFGSTYEAIGKEVHQYSSEEGSDMMRIGAVSTTIRYDNFSNYENYIASKIDNAIMQDLTGSSVTKLEFCLRVSPQADKDFINKFREDMSAQLRVGNYFLSKIEYIPDNKANFQAGNKRELFNRIAIAIFLLVNILLGVLGVFWFRTQARVREMGVRLSCGDTPRGILSRYYLEGLILLFLSLIPAMGLMLYLNSVGGILNTWFMKFTVDRYFIGYLLTFGLVALMIIIGIWFPARKAIRITPAEALATE